jgi:TctA family transporter
MGINPGPVMLNEKLSLSFSMVIVLVLSNILATVFCILVTKQAARIAWVPSNLIIPALMVFALFGAYASYTHPASLLVTLAFGALGYAMMNYGWARVPLLIGFILGPIAENNLSISLASYGMEFLLRPIPIVLLALMAMIVGFAARRALRRS